MPQSAHAPFLEEAVVELRALRSSLDESGRPRMAEAALFHRCRKALGLSQPAIPRALLIVSDRTIRRWEQGELTVAGPAWVALEDLLTKSNEIAFADKVAQVVQQRRVEIY
jgi:DNA-binding transcriptional regulator YiaG